MLIDSASAYPYKLLFTAFLSYNREELESIFLVSIINDIFQPLYGKPCWQVKQGYGSFLTFEFGEPHLHIREPRQVSDQVSEKVKKAPPGGI